MYLTDYHCHSILSMDGRVPLGTLAQHMLQAGVSEMCLTDHFDLFDGSARRCYARDLDWPAALAQLEEGREQFRGRLTIRLGLEYGMGHVDPAVSEAVLAQPALDFVIGSVHNLSPARGGVDLYFEDMSTPAACQSILADYFSSLEALVETDYYDSLGHIIYPLRYMNGLAKIEDYMDRVDTLLKALIRRGKAMEVNTYRGRTVADWAPLLKRYKALGGQLLTVGSDAHDPRHAGAGIAAAYELIQACGFHAVCTYEKRQPTLIKI